MTCGICGRKLKSEESIRTGYGPVCFQKKFGKPAKIRAKPKEREPDGECQYYEIPGQMNIEDFLQE